MVFLSRVLRRKETQELAKNFNKWYFKIQNYNKYGLYHDDILNSVEIPENVEAVRRLPPDLYDGRVFRVIRATQLDITKEFLPKEQWTTYEDDQTKGRYLQPYIKEVLAEWQEKEDWDKEHGVV